MKREKKLSAVATVADDIQITVRTDGSEAVPSDAFPTLPQSSGTLLISDLPQNRATAVWLRFKKLAAAGVRPMAEGGAS